MTEETFYDSIADEQELMICSIPIEGKNGVNVVKNFKDVIVGAFIKLREEDFQSSFTVFMGKRAVFPSGISTGLSLTMWSWNRQWVRNVASADFGPWPRSGRL